jgi:DNA invertase Pin-like site-specific DNA recombinase
VNLDPDPDIIEIIMRACEAGGLDAEAAKLIENRIRTEYGGMRVRIPKKNKSQVEQVHAKAFADGVSSMPTREVVQKHGISRATLYRLMKRR